MWAPYFVGVATDDIDGTDLAAGIFPVYLS
jgi:hypothetical protein